MTKPVETLIDEAWRQCYLDPARARLIGHELVDRGEPGWGGLHIALAEVRIGDAAKALDVAQRAREAFEAGGDATGVALCDEVIAIHRRRIHDVDGCRALHRDIDARPGLRYTSPQDFIAQNSRAITAKLLGETDEALRRFYAAVDAARRSGLAGPQVTALGNLGGYHQGLFNHQDALELCEQALDRARAIGARQAMATAMANLVMIHHAQGRHQDALAQARALEACTGEVAPGTVGRFSTIVAIAHLGVGDVESAQRLLDRGAVAGVADGDGVAQWAWLTARCLLARDEAAAAHRVVEDALAGERRCPPYDMLELLRAGADVCEALGDIAGALARTRQAQARYEELVGCSARARYIALQVGHELSHARSERDSAQRNLQRMAELNRALEAKIAETELLHAQLREQALRDPLTGLHNRRYLFEIGPGLIELARRNGTPLCVALIDLDHFKTLNDEHGHQAGDLVLQRFARLLSAGLRRSDVVCRHGGEEFVVLMPEVSLGDASDTMERMLNALRAESLTHGRQLLPPCAFSAGLAEFPEQGDTLEQLLSRADRALYRAKDAGRARIERAISGHSTFT